MLPRGGMGDFNQRRGQPGWNDPGQMGGGVPMSAPGMMAHFQGAPIMGAGNFPGSMPNMQDMGNQNVFLDGGGGGGNFGGGGGLGVGVDYGAAVVSGFGVTVGNMGFAGGNGTFPGNFGGGGGGGGFGGGNDGGGGGGGGGVGNFQRGGMRGGGDRSDRNAGGNGRFRNGSGGRNNNNNHRGRGSFGGTGRNNRNRSSKSPPSRRRNRDLDNISDSSYSDDDVPRREKPSLNKGAEAEEPAKSGKKKNNNNNEKSEGERRKKSSPSGGGDKRGGSRSGGKSSRDNNKDASKSRDNKPEDRSNRPDATKSDRPDRPDKPDRPDRPDRPVADRPRHQNHRPLALQSWDKSNVRFWNKLKDQTRDQLHYLIDNVYTEDVKKSIGANAQLSQYSMVKFEAYLLNFEGSNFPIFKAEAQALATAGIELEDIAKRQLERIGSRMMKDNSGDKSHFRFKLNSYDAYLRSLVNRKALPIQWHDLRTLAFHWPPFEDAEEGRLWLIELMKRFYALGALTVVMQKEGLLLEGEDSTDPHCVMAEEPFPPLVRSVLLVTFFFPETVDLLADLKLSMEKRPLVVHRVRAVAGGYEKVLSEGFPLYVSLLPPQDSALTRPKDFVNILGPGALARQFLGLPAAALIDPMMPVASASSSVKIHSKSNHGGESRGAAASPTSKRRSGSYEEGSKDRHSRKEKKDEKIKPSRDASSPSEGVAGHRHHRHHKKHSRSGEAPRTNNSKSRSRSPRDRKSRSKSRSKKHRSKSSHKKHDRDADMEHEVSSTSGNTMGGGGPAVGGGGEKQPEDGAPQETVIKYFLTSSADEKMLDCEEVKKYFLKFGELDWCIQSGLNKMAAAFAFKDSGISTLVAGYGHRINKRAVILQPMGDHGPVGQPTVATEIAAGTGSAGESGSSAQTDNGGQGGSSRTETASKTSSDDDAIRVDGFGKDVSHNVMSDLKSFIHSKANQLGVSAADFRGLATMEMRKTLNGGDYYAIVTFKERRDADLFLTHPSHVMPAVDGGVGGRGDNKEIHFSLYHSPGQEVELEEMKNTRTLFVTNFPEKSSGIAINEEVVGNHFRKHGSIQRIMLGLRKTGFGGIMSTGKPGDLYALVTYYNVTAAEAANQSRHVIPGSDAPLAVTWYTRQEDWEEDKNPPKDDKTHGSTAAGVIQQQAQQQQQQHSNTMAAQQHGQLYGSNNGSSTYPTSAASNPIQSTFVQPTASGGFFPPQSSRPPAQFSVPPPAWPQVSSAGGLPPGFPPSMGMPPPGPGQIPPQIPGFAPLHYPPASYGAPPPQHVLPPPQQHQQPQMQQQRPLSSDNRNLPDNDSQNSKPRGDGNDDATNAILVTGFQPDLTYNDLNQFFRGLGKIRRCFLKMEEPRFLVVTYEFLTDAKKACTSAVKTSLQMKLNETDEITVLPLQEHPEATSEALHSCSPPFPNARHINQANSRMQSQQQSQPQQQSLQPPPSMPAFAGPPPMQPPPGFFPPPGAPPSGATLAPPGVLPPPPAGFAMAPPQANLPGVPQNAYPPFGY